MGFYKGHMHYYMLISDINLRSDNIYNAYLSKINIFSLKFAININQ
jgi:hypothetical protein